MCDVSDMIFCVATFIEEQLSSSVTKLEGNVSYYGTYVCVRLTFCVCNHNIVWLHAGQLLRSSICDLILENRPNCHNYNISRNTNLKY